MQTRCETTLFRNVGWRGETREIFPRLNSLTSTGALVAPRRLPVASFCSWPSYRREATFLGTFAVLARLAWFHDDRPTTTLDPNPWRTFPLVCFLSLSLCLFFIPSPRFSFCFANDDAETSRWKIHSPITLTFANQLPLSFSFFSFSYFFLAAGNNCYISFCAWKFRKFFLLTSRRENSINFFFSFLGDLKETLDFYINLKSVSSNRAEIFLLHSL